MRNKIAIFDCCRQGDWIWFSNLSFNSLMQMNLNTCEINIIGKFPNYKIETRNLHRRVFLYKNKLYFIPRAGKTIDIYNISENKFKSVKVPETKGPIADAIKIDKEIWMFPSSTKDSVYVFNTDKEIITTHAWLFTQINKDAQNMDLVLDISSVTYNNHLIWVGIYNKNLLYQIDAEKGVVQKITLPDNFQINSINMRDNILWVTDALYPKIIRVNNGQLEEYYAEATIQQNSLSQIIETEKYYIVLPHYATYILLSEKEEQQIHKIPLPNWISRCRMGPLLFASEIVENICIFIPFSLDCVLYFDMGKKIWSKKNYHIQELSDAKIQEMLEMNIEQQKYSGEMGEGIGWEDTLPIFIEKVQKQLKSQCQKNYANSGNCIFKDAVD